MKKINFLVLCILIIASQSIGQNITDKKALLDFAANKSIEEQRQKAEAINYAKQNNIPVVIDNEEVLLELMYIDDYGQPQYYMTENAVSSATISTNKVNSGGGFGYSLDGSGMTVHEWDGGAVRITHQEYSGRAVMGDGVTSDHYHSAHVAGTMIASGVQAIAKGMAPAANLRAFDWNSDESEMATEAANNALVSNHSYGYGRGWVWTGTAWSWYGNTSISTQEDYLFGFYDSQAQDWDQIAGNAPYYLIVKSAGNDRGDGPTNGSYPQDGPYDCISHSGISKNIMTVGAVEDIPGGYSQPSDVVMSSFSSWGPADDGRIKPDISTNGVSLYSSDVSNDSDYQSLSGTSMASPSAAGSLILLQELYEDLNGNGNFMRASTLKAVAIHTADEAGPNDGPDYMFGWGLMNTKAAADVISDDASLNTLEEITLNNGGNYQRTVTAAGGEKLQVTIVWTDIAGTPTSNSLDPSNPMIVNELDVKITQASNTYYPWKLDRNNPSSAATRSGENNVDNVEMVTIDNPTGGMQYTIVVDHDGSLSGGSQIFSLVVTGITSGTPMPPVADFNADNTTPLTGSTVTFNDLSTNVPTSWSWTFSPATVTYVNGTSSSSQNPEVTFDVTGTYSVEMAAANGEGSDTETKTNYITVTDPVPFALPWTEDFEDVTTLTYTANASNAGGLEEWSYEKTANGRLRFAAGSGFYHSGSYAATIDANPSGTYSVNYLIATLNLSDYSTSTELELTFSFMHHGEESHTNDRVWIRGSDSDSWIEAYDLYANMGSAGSWNSVTALDIDALLSNNGQSPSATFQIRFGQEDNYPATSTTASDGFTFDDITVSEADPSAYIISSFPYSQSWEAGIGLWRQGTADNFDWTRDSGGTPSSSTGPTTGHDGSYYMYTESSSPRANGDEAHLEATFDFSSLSSPEFSFYYHMFGVSIASLHVDVFDGSWTNDVWVANGPQQSSQTDSYELAEADLSAWGGENNIVVRFRGIVGSGAGSTYYSDIAIDLIEVVGGANPTPPTCTAPASPTNGATDVSINSSLDWNAATGATGYYLYLGTDVNATNIINGTDLGNVTSYDPGTLTYSTTYYWYVVPYNAFGNATGCGIWSFITEVQPPPPSCTAPASPTNGATDVSINSSLDWNAATGATGYYLYLGTDVNATNIINGTDLGNVTSYDPGTLTYSTTYYWYVVPYNAFGNATGCGIWSFITEVQPPPPSCTAPASPTNGATDVSINSSLDWNAATGATGYYLYLGTDVNATNIINGTDLGNVTSYDPGTLTYSTTYYWYVVPYNAFGNATGCGIWSFITEVQPPPPSCTAPASPTNGATDVSINSSLDWNAATGATGYYLYLGTDVNATNIINGTDLGNVTSYDPGTLTYSTTYYWYVVPYNAFGNATGCGIWSFITEESGPSIDVLSYSDFESGWGIWTDGGGDCLYYTGGTYAYGGSDAADIQDNSGVASSFYMTNGVDVDSPDYIQIDIEFYFIAVSMDNTKEDFWVQYYDGSTWHTVASFVKGIDFDNGVFYVATVSILESNYVFPNDMKIRFMCDASGNRDDVYIDDITISASTQIIQNETLVVVEDLMAPVVFSDEIDEEVGIYPNPATDKLHIVSNVADKMEVAIFSTTGQLMYYETDLDNHEIIDISRFDSGIYVVRVLTDGEIITKKLIKQ